MSITVYTKPNCMQCQMTYRALDSAHLEYEVVDITEVPAALEYVTEELGYRQAPVVVADDDDHWSGFQPDQIKRLTKRAILPSDAS
ncbi:glutaredoxin-like protein NrdH [Microbacterium sp. NPDC080220]|uniref:glutaredoxin-like protein NrdH n=1 Tax=Microbacterium sp. NPDC080220 TaxID=3161017 RepID=UPI0034384FD3